MPSGTVVDEEIPQEEQQPSHVINYLSKGL